MLGITLYSFLLLKCKNLYSQPFQGDALDQIELILSAENCSRRQIGNKLKELGLISKMEEVTRKPLKSSREWQEAESDKLR